MTDEPIIYSAHTSDVEAILARQVILCSFCGSQTDAQHVFSIGADGHTGSIDEILATCDPCTDTMQRFLMVMQHGLRQFVDPSDRL